MEKIKNLGNDSLKRLGGFFETDIDYVAKSGFWLSLGQIYASLLALALSIFFANFVSKEIYGQYKFILSATGILGALSLTGMGNVVIQGVAKGSEGVLKKAVNLSLKWGTIIVAMGLSSSIYYFINKNSILGFSFVIASLSLPLINAFSLYGGYLSGKKNFKMSTVYWAVSQTIISIGVILISIFTKNILSLVIVYFSASAGVAVWSYFHVLSKYKPNHVQDETIMSYGKHMSFINFFGTLSNQLDKILVFHFLGATQVAIYVFSQAIPEQIKGSFKNLFAIALPKYATLSDSDLRKSILKKTNQLTVISILIVVFYITISPFIFTLLFPKYLESVVYSQIYMLGLIAIPGISLFGVYFQIKKDARTMYKLSMTSNIVTTLLTFILIYKYGIKGAVIENGLSWLIMLCINYYFFATHKEELLLPK